MYGGLLRCRRLASKCGFVRDLETSCPLRCQKVFNRSVKLAGFCDHDRPGGEVPEDGGQNNRLVGACVQFKLHGFPFKRHCHFPLVSSRTCHAADKSNFVVAVVRWSNEADLLGKTRERQTAEKCLFLWQVLQLSHVSNWTGLSGMAGSSTP